MITVAGGILLAIVFILLLPFILPIIGVILRFAWYGILLLIAIILLNSWG